MISDYLIVSNLIGWLIEAANYNLQNLDHRTLSERTSKHTSELCNKHSELTNKQMKSYV